MSKLTIELSHEDYQRLNLALKVTRNEVGPHHGFTAADSVKRIMQARQILGMGNTFEFLLLDFDPEKDAPPSAFYYAESPTE